LGLLIAILHDQNKDILLMRNRLSASINTTQHQ